MPSFAVDVEFEVFCAKCGNGLCNQSTTESKGSYRGTVHSVNVEPCETCLRAEYDRGYQDGIE